MLMTKFITVILLVKLRAGTQGQLLWDRARCALDPEDSIPEGTAADIGRFPWLGVVQHSFVLGGQTRFAVTSGVLIHPSYAIAPAEDIAKIRPEALINNTVFVVWYSQSVKFSVEVKDYSLHPEYSDAVTFASLALLELNTYGQVGISEVKTPILPICLNLEGAAPLTNLYAIKMNDIKGELHKEVYKMDYVEDADCDEFYYRAKLTYTRMTPSRYICAVSELQRDACVWEGGVALVARQQWGYWKLIGFSVRGPGCGAPTRFILIASYMQWIDDVISIVDVLGEDLDEDTHKIYFRRLSPIKLEMYKGNMKKPLEQGQCDQRKRGRVMFKDQSELSVTSNLATGFYFVSVSQIAQFSCAIVSVEAMTKTNAAVWVEHHCHRENTGLAPNMPKFPDIRKLECYMYFKSNAFVEFRFFFSFKAVIELSLYGHEDLPRWVANPFALRETTEEWLPTDNLLKWGVFTPYYLYWWQM